MIVASAQDWAKAQGRGGDRKSDQSAILHFDSVEKRAAQSGASLPDPHHSPAIVPGFLLPVVLALAYIGQQTSENRLHPPLHRDQETKNPHHCGLCKTTLSC